MYKQYDPHNIKVRTVLGGVKKATNSLFALNMMFVGIMKHSL